MIQLNHFVGFADVLQPDGVVEVEHQLGPALAEQLLEADVARHQGFTENEDDVEVVHPFHIPPADGMAASNETGLLEVVAGLVEELVVSFAHNGRMLTPVAVLLQVALGTVQTGSAALDCGPDGAG
ncbi:MAG: hypothetical protein IPP26_08290 [Flavobacteriales bacterium]|nr:hypothetical protein [Flavobacteriales bacterium]